MSLAGKRVLVTGSLGFTGHYIVEALQQQGALVSGCGHKTTLLEKALSYPYFTMDLTDSLSVKSVIDKVKPQVVVHLAAISFVGHADAAAFYQVNLLGTYNLLSVLYECNSEIEKILIASSANVYGNATADFIDEQQPYQPENDYAVSKVAMEQMAKLWFSRLPIVITRPFNYTGVGQAEHFLIPKIVSHFRSRAERIRLGNLDVSRDYTDVRRLTQAYVMLLQKPISSVIVNICSGKTWRLDQVMSLCKTITGHKIIIDQDFTLMRGNEIKVLCGDSSLFNDLLGDEITNIPFEKTLEWMLDEC